MDLEGHLRSNDRTTITLLLGQGVNVEVNRELQASGGLVLLMGIAIVGLLYVSLRRLTDVVIVMFALGTALLWMQGMIGHFSSLTSWFGLSLIARSQFSNLLPILVLALGIDDSLHALHRYKEERAKSFTPEEAAQTTLQRVKCAIMLTSITTMAAFAANVSARHRRTEVFWYRSSIRNLVWHSFLLDCGASHPSFGRQMDARAKDEH